MRRFGFAFLLTAIAVLVTVVSAQAQTRRLPSDLLVSVRKGNQLSLVKVNAETLELSQFFSNLSNQSVFGLNAIAWSPNGQWLAIIQHVGAVGDHSEICILDRSGVFQRCMDEGAVWGSNDFGTSQFEALTWSADSQKVYYAVQVPDRLLLVEADVATGKTTRAIFEAPKTESLPYALMVWSVDKGYVVVGDHYNPPPYKFPLQIVSLTAAPASPERQQDVLSVIPRQEVNRLCPRVSPQGTYFVVLADGEYEAKRIVLFNQHNQIVHQIGSSTQFPDLTVTCPEWQSDEQALYFAGYSPADEEAQIFRYVLPEGKLTVWYRSVRGTTPLGGMAYPIRLSLDEQVIAGRAESPPVGNIRVGVVFADGYELAIQGEYDYVVNPLWFPPTQ